MRYRLDDGQIEVVDDAVAEILRRKTPAERIGMVGDAWASAREWLRAVIASQQPGWDPKQVDQQVARRLLGDAR